MNFLKDLDKDIIVHRMGLYSIKRYSYKSGINWVDNEGKTIDEPIYSFILMRGEKWFNDSNKNFRESELTEVISTYEAILKEMTAERRQKLTEERAGRKLFPRKHEFVFENITIVAIERPCYYSAGNTRTYGNYFEKTEKIVEFFANGSPYRSDKHTKFDTIIDLEFVLQNTIKNSIQHHYTKHDFTEKYVSDSTTKLDFHYIPMIFILGYVYEIDGEDIEFYDCSYSRFQTSKGDLELPLSKIMTGKIVGELQGMKAYSSLIARMKFV